MNHTMAVVNTLNNIINKAKARTARIMIFMLCSMLILTSCQTTDEISENTEFTVSVASSMSNVMEDIVKQYEQTYDDVKITLNYGGSGKLAQQITQGAPVDVFVSANTYWMDKLHEDDFIISNTQKTIAGNTLVMVVNKNTQDNISSFDELSVDNVQHIALGDPETVPAGKYAKEVLQSIQKWNDVASLIVLAKDVRQVLTYVESGNVDVGFVYVSDAMTSEEVQIVGQADSAWHSPIMYTAAAVANRNESEAAEAFIQYLISDQAQSIFDDYGFEMIE
ncbi:molybdate ABC transporter substrate-binding protein [Longirhabdus pacifica]|uniref:molybdate ABC transporter substrate-binding protein n=1 Tax=Longirhabdus pacifica TaxID=2305227 RepID=UPI001008AE35|nr:molybdate ABC transporter substrate-binding protein [Longirhabdus pacifica]